MIDVLVVTAKIAGLAAALSMGIALLIRIIDVVLGALRPAPPPPARARTPAVPPAPEEVAAIAAAVYAALGPHRILHIAERGYGSAWTAEGRATHHASHGVAHGAPHPPAPKVRRR